MKKPTEAALEAFEYGFPNDERAERKQMFGMPAGFVNGNMFYGVFANGVVFRVGEDVRDEMCEQDGIVPFEPMPGRPWREYIHADADRWSESEELQTWAIEALEFTARMPPK